MALSLVPPNRVDDAWLAIDADSPSYGHEAHELLSTFKSYFISTWLENWTVFPRELWNHYG